MPAQGFCLQVTYTGPGTGAFYVDDIHDAFDTRNMRQNDRKPGPLYLNVGVPADLIFTSDVAKSYESGKIRRLIDDGRATASFLFGSGVGSAFGFEQIDVDAAVDPVLVMTTSGRPVVDTTVGAVDIYLPPILDDTAMAPVEIVIAVGLNPVTIRPAPGTSDGVVGTAGSTYVLDPFTETSITLYPDSTRHIWQL
jgi:hypothetical protein